MKADAEERRLARRLAVAGMRLEIGGEGAAALCGAGGARRSAVDSAAARRLLARGALAAAGAGVYVLSEAGRAMVRRWLAGGDDMAAQHQSRARRVLEGDGARRSVVVDLAESPLAWLHARKDRDGRPMIDDAAFAAGERLRTDFTRGQLMPGITANWSLAGGSSRGGGAAGGAAELTEAALSARMRVERALAALGPELSGAVVDLCCFLKPLEQIEGERRWPRRSAKLVLRLGLGALARHYGLSSEAVGGERRRTG